MTDSRRRLSAEALGTAFLLATVVGSGIMARATGRREHRARAPRQHDADRRDLVVLILTFGPISGAHFNPAVSLAFALRGDLPGAIAWLYIVAQVVGGLAGVLVAHAMFELPLCSYRAKARTGPGQWLAEVVATFGLLLDDPGCIRCAHRGRALCRRALHHGRLLVHGFDLVRQSGRDRRSFPLRHLRRHRPGDVPAFIVAQLIGMAGAVRLSGWLWPEPANRGTGTF